MKSAIGVVLSMVLLALTVSSYAETLPAQFTLVQISGECAVKLPNETSFKPAKDGDTYPCGTTIETGRKSSAVARFSPDNECRLLAKTTLVIDQSTRDNKMKNIKLAQGKVDVKLTPEFHRDNSLQVETPTAICGAVQCNFTVEVIKQIGGAVQSLFTTIEGIVNVHSSTFSVPVMKAGAALQVSGDSSLTHISVTVQSGTLQIQTSNGSGGTQTTSIEPGTTITVTREALPANPNTPDAVPQESVKVTITNPDGTTQSVTYTQAATTLPPAPPVPTTPPPPVAQPYDAQALQ